jgi:hypothetical protein
MKCPACDSEELSEEASFASFENSARFKDWEPGILQYKELSVGAETARICLACGYILHFAGAQDLAKLRAGRPA